MDERWIAAAVIFLMSLHGLILNMTVAIFASRVTSLKNAFGRLSVSQAAGEAVFCSMYIFYYTLMVFFDISAMMDKSNYAGVILSATYSICSLSHLLIALNRLCAICAPTRYDIIFSVSNTNAMVIVTWTVAALSTVFINSYSGCSFMYKDEFYTFTFVSNERTFCFEARNLYSSKDFTILALTLLFDLATIIAVRRTAKATKNMSGEVYANHLMELKLLKQAVAQAAAFAVQISCVAFFSMVSDSKWMIWAFTAVAWNLLHLIDPVIIIAFNKEFRRLILSLLKLSPSKPRKSHTVFHTRPLRSATPLTTASAYL
ncbi:unnamed protein product [Cylicocyclus nassatus]|uniref:7TM GPCR serpentine receptor class x (Srx) domain-containing protein n=1 Tax=Cylicocyclus nassatus TaxID=53992 RepID=A0AA36MEP1_CYLNA|nr:unnamed protein product [Cylicocyclus nassatus]